MRPDHRPRPGLRQADQRAVRECERLLDRISCLAQALGTARELFAIYRALQVFCLVSVPCDGFFVSLYDPEREVRTACYGWGDGCEIDVSELPPMPITSAGPNSRAVTTGQIIITDDYMNLTADIHRSLLAGQRTRPGASGAPMAVMGQHGD
jgi:hypothetical protein